MKSCPNSGTLGVRDFFPQHAGSEFILADKRCLDWRTQREVISTSCLGKLGQGKLHNAA